MRMDCFHRWAGGLLTIINMPGGQGQNYFGKNVTRSSKPQESFCFVLQKPDRFPKWAALSAIEPDLQRILAVSAEDLLPNKLAGMRSTSLVLRSKFWVLRHGTTTN